ncbi:MAG: NAD(P)/FAD-dependent oxidoreductase [bacterium]
MNIKMPDEVIIIGGGASGLMAAGRAAECGASVLLLEKMNGPGLKLLISGKGRCNLTNAGEIEEFLQNFGATRNFLRHAFHRLSNENLAAFFQGRGLALKTERGGRIFPETDQASSVLDVLLGYLREGRVRIRFQSKVRSVEARDGKVTGVTLADGSFLPARSVVLATGGKSYPGTGSTGDGYAMAERLGHIIVPLRPALVPLAAKEDFIRSLQGLSLRNVRAALQVSGKEETSEFGEMLFTHFGVSGPIILSLSAAAGDLIERHGKATLSIDLKPALDENKLQERLLRDMKDFGRREFKNYLAELLPKKMIEVFLKLLKIPPEKKVNQLTKEERARLINLLKDFSFTIAGTRPIEEAIVTRGGVQVREIDPHTMASRLLKNLFFCGEIIDVDARTGGYNLQAAFSTGYLAGESAAAEARGNRGKA